MNAWNSLSNVKMLPRLVVISTDLTSVSVEKICTGLTTNAKVCLQMNSVVIWRNAWLEFVLIYQWFGLIFNGLFSQSCFTTIICDFLQLTMFLSGFLYIHTYLLARPHRAFQIQCYSNNIKHRHLTTRKIINLTKGGVQKKSPKLTLKTFNGFA